MNREEIDAIANKIMDFLRDEFTMAYDKDMELYLKVRQIIKDEV